MRTKPFINIPKVYCLMLKNVSDWNIMFDPSVVFMEHSTVQVNLIIVLSLAPIETDRFISETMF